MKAELDRLYGLYEDDARCLEGHQCLQGLLQRTRGAFPGAWRDLQKELRYHPIHGLLLEDPFTRWGLEKPRGYPGDAWLIDFIYQHASVSKALRRSTRRGRILYEANVGSPGARSVPKRRDILTELVKSAIQRNPEARILSIASGLLRELEPIQKIFSTSKVRMHAIDHDPRIIDSIRSIYGQRVIAHNIGVGAFLRGEMSAKPFDLIYSAGLCDYLYDDLFENLLLKCLATIRKGGIIVLANVTEANPNLAYLEAAMDWQLITRSRRHMAALARRCGIAQKELDCFDEGEGMIEFIKVQR